MDREKCISIVRCTSRNDDVKGAKVLHASHGKVGLISTDIRVTTSVNCLSPFCCGHKVPRKDLCERLLSEPFQSKKVFWCTSYTSSRHPISLSMHETICCIFDSQIRMYLMSLKILLPVLRSVIDILHVRHFFVVRVFSFLKFRRPLSSSNSQLVTDPHQANQPISALLSSELNSPITTLITITIVANSR